jgi:hypothetical protein
MGGGHSAEVNAIEGFTKDRRAAPPQDAHGDGKQPKSHHPQLTLQQSSPPSAAKLPHHRGPCASRGARWFAGSLVCFRG